MHANIQVVVPMKENQKKTSAEKEAEFYPLW